MPTLELEVVYAHDSLNALDFWSTVEPYLERAIGLPDWYEVCAVSKGRRHCTEARLYTFLDGHTGSFTVQASDRDDVFGPFWVQGDQIPWEDFQHFKFRVETEVDQSMMADVVKSLPRRSELISVYCYDKDYKYWQQTAEPDRIERMGKPFPVGPVIHNGSPKPLGRRVIDTTRNTGRQMFRGDHVEAVTATMWLGPRFSERTGCYVDGVLSQPWLDCERDDDGVIKIVAQPDAFTMDRGREADRQDAMRLLLFPHTFEKVGGNRSTEGHELKKRSRFGESAD